MRKNRASGFTLLELMIIVAILGIIAAAAIPAYIKYIRRSETVEATMALRRMYDGAVAYFVSEHADAAGGTQNKRFPDSAGPTPAAVPQATRVLVPSAEWKTPEWAALNFAVRDPQRFSFSFISNGQTGTAAFAKTLAQGDLDGDQVYSTFARTIQGVPDGVRGSSGMIMINEIE